MSKQIIPRKLTNAFSSFSVSFSEGHQKFQQFLKRPNVTVASLVEQAVEKSRNYSKEKREVLVETLKLQLKDIASEKQLQNLDKLSDEHTVTITTGHQLTLFGGPMYFVYKALHTVRLTEEFNRNQSEFQAVPIFWLASEDHDFEEVKGTYLFQQNLSWETEQNGAVGRFEMDGFDAVFEQFKDQFKNDTLHAAFAVFNETTTSENYAALYQRFLTVLFADFGLIVIQPDEKALKAEFKQVIERELLENVSFDALQRQNEELMEAEISPQAHGRKINLFYLGYGGRHRIEVTSSGFSINGIVWEKERLQQEVEQNPHEFSPNVILRPVYQETILPNICYIGGGAEMNYWLQLVQVFEEHTTIFPLLMQRVSMHLIDKTTRKKIEKIGWEDLRFFEHKDELRKAYLLEKGGDQIDFSEVRATFELLREKMVLRAKQIDVSLESFAEAESVRIEKQIETYEQKIIKHLKNQHEQALKQIDAIGDKFIKDGELQERKFHWLNFTRMSELDQFLQFLHEEINPFEQNLILLDV